MGVWPGVWPVAGHPQERCRDGRSGIPEKARNLSLDLGPWSGEMVAAVRLNAGLAGRVALQQGGRHVQLNCPFAAPHERCVRLKERQIGWLPIELKGELLGVSRADLECDGRPDRAD